MRQKWNKWHGSPDLCRLGCAQSNAAGPCGAQVGRPALLGVHTGHNRPKSSRRSDLCICATLLLTTALGATPVEKPKLPPALDHIVQLANATPPEFEANALLEVAAAPKLDPALRKDLINRAFHIAPGAQLQTPLNAITQVADTPDGMLAAAARLKLDTLSLQTRAVRAMLPLDKKAARNLFLEINPPTIETTCGQTLIPDVADLYATLGLVANSTFTEREREKEQHINLLLTYMSRAASPVEIAPIEQMIANLNLTPDQHDALIIRLNGLRQSLAAPNCPAAKKPATFWQSDQAKHLYEAGVRLRSERADTPEWRRQLTDYLAELAAWTPAGEKDEATYFHEKSIIYEMLIELTPAGPDRENEITAFVDLLASSNLQRDKPAEWFAHAESLITRTRNANIDAAKIWAAFAASGNPGLLLYTALAHLSALTPIS